MPDILKLTETGYMRVPQHFDFRPHLEKAALIIKNYTTIFMLNGDMLGSGVWCPHVRPWDWI